ncbi:MAG TPA: hypothetical protein VFZ65_03750 [Planctomycetota bacterium]|nr:hypothetical protein [Planctomycetota bacterium]
MRLCPSVEGSAPPLITHRIGVEVCLARQATFFHKCHRCIYRGQPAGWEPDEAPLAMLNIHAAEEPGRPVKLVEIPRADEAGAEPAPEVAPAPAKRRPKAPGRSAAKGVKASAPTR